MHRASVQVAQAPRSTHPASVHCVDVSVGPATPPSDTSEPRAIRTRAHLQPSLAQPTPSLRHLHQYLAQVSRRLRPPVTSLAPMAGAQRNCDQAPRKDDEASVQPAQVPRPAARPRSRLAMPRSRVTVSPSDPSTSPSLRRHRDFWGNRGALLASPASRRSGSHVTRSQSPSPTPPRCRGVRPSVGGWKVGIAWSGRRAGRPK